MNLSEYEKRIDSLSRAYQQSMEQIINDEILNTMKEDKTS